MGEISLKGFEKINSRRRVLGGRDDRRYDLTVITISVDQMVATGRLAPHLSAVDAMGGECRSSNIAASEFITP
jgi:hypothetical protein